MESAHHFPSQRCKRRRRGPRGRLRPAARRGPAPLRERRALGARHGERSRSWNTCCLWLLMCWLLATVTTCWLLTIYLRVFHRFFTAFTGDSGSFYVVVCFTVFWSLKRALTAAFPGRPRPRAADPAGRPRADERPSDFHCIYDHLRVIFALYLLINSARWRSLYV